jgi:hypothetical protein
LDKKYQAFNYLFLIFKFAVKKYAKRSRATSFASLFTPK